MMESLDNSAISATSRETSKLPVLPAFDDGQNYLVWCKDCDWWHRHGRANGHVLAHCSPVRYRSSVERREPTLYVKTGYVLHLVCGWHELPEAVRSRKRRLPSKRREIRQHADIPWSGTVAKTLKSIKRLRSV